jgi:hypothetical protein
MNSWPAEASPQTVGCGRQPSGSLDAVITSTAAQELILDRLGNAEEGFCIQPCERSPRGDYRILRANSEACVVHGDPCGKNVPKRHVRTLGVLSEAIAGDDEGGAPS